MIAYAINLSLRTWRWQIILRPVAAIPYPIVARALLVGYGLNTIMPARLGELFRAEFFKKTFGLSRIWGLTSIVIERLFDGLTVVTCLGIGGRDPDADHIPARRAFSVVCCKSCRGRIGVRRYAGPRGSCKPQHARAFWAGLSWDTAVRIRAGNRIFRRLSCAWHSRSDARSALSPPSSRDCRDRCSVPRIGKVLVFPACKTEVGRCTCQTVTWSHSVNYKVLYSSIIAVAIELQGAGWVADSHLRVAITGYPGDLRGRSCRSRTAPLLYTISPIPRETPLECQRSCGAMNSA